MCVVLNEDHLRNLKLICNVSVVGRYVNIQTGKSVTFQEAMANGDITVEIKSQKKVREEKSSYGLITVTTTKETRPYTITSVTDPKTEKQLSPDEAYAKGSCRFQFTGLVSSNRNISAIFGNFPKSTEMAELLRLGFQ